MNINILNQIPKPFVAPQPSVAFGRIPFAEWLTNMVRNFSQDNQIQTTPINIKASPLLSLGDLLSQNLQQQLQQTQIDERIQKRTSATNLIAQSGLLSASIKEIGNNIWDKLSSREPESQTPATTQHLLNNTFQPQVPLMQNFSQVQQYLTKNPVYNPYFKQLQSQSYKKQTVTKKQTALMRGLKSSFSSALTKLKNIFVKQAHN